MRPRSRLRFSIGQWTALVAAVAMLYSLPHQKTTADFQLVGSIFALLPVVLLVSVLVDAVVGIPCPGCGRWTLRRLARARPYYCCSQCRGRYKRFGLGTWRDAADPTTTRSIAGGRVPGHGSGSRSPRTTMTRPPAALAEPPARREKAPAPSSAGTLIFGWKSRARSWLGFTTPRDQGDTTTGLLLRNQQRRRTGPRPLSRETNSAGQLRYHGRRSAF